MLKLEFQLHNKQNCQNCSTQRKFIAKLYFECSQQDSPFINKEQLHLIILVAAAYQLCVISLVVNLKLVATIQPVMHSSSVSKQYVSM
jgi:hypothetical protein